MSTLERQAWLASLKPGDKVAVECNYSPEYGYDYVIKTVEQVTSTGYIRLVGGGQYQPNGTKAEKSIWSQYGWGDPCYKLVEITPEIEAHMQRLELLSRMKNIDWYQLNIEELEKIAQVLAKRSGE
jgi:hypothetical protein